MSVSRFQWCDCQMKAKEDVGKGTWTCCAHLADGHAFQCRRDPRDVYVDEDGRYNLEGCPDFHPPHYDRNKVDRHRDMVSIPRTSNPRDSSRRRIVR